MPAPKHFEVAYVVASRVVALAHVRPSDAFHAEAIAYAEPMAKVHAAPVEVYVADERIVAVHP